MVIETLLNPVTGESMDILESSDERFVIKYALKPRGRIPLEHFHPNVSQEFEVRSGEMHVTVNGEHIAIKAGESRIAPASARHFQWNPHDEEVIAIETYRPASRNHHFFKTLFALAQQGYTDENGMPLFLFRMALFYEFRDTIRPADTVPRFLISLLGPLCVALGYRAKIRALLD